MRTSEEKYISLLTDFGFKRIFGSQPKKDDIKEYEDSLKAYRDIQNSIDTAKEEGFAKGMAKGIEQGIAKGEQKIVQAMQWYNKAVMLTSSQKLQASLLIR